MATDNSKIKASIELLRKKNEKYYTKLNVLIRDNNDNLTMNISSQLGNKNMNYEKVDAVKIQNNTDKIMRATLTIKNNLAEMKLLSKQLLLPSIDVNQEVTYLSEINYQKSIETREDF